MQFQKMIRSFRYAFNGLKYTFLHENNFKFQLLTTLLAIAAGVWLQIATSDWIAISICCGLVLSMEIMNTAIEKTIDLISPELQTKAGLIKDLSAAAVLVASIASVIVAVFILSKYTVRI